MCNSSVSLTQHWDDRVDLALAPGSAPTSGRDARQVSYRFGGVPKPCVHPLCTAAGHRISGFEMSDHVWHRGLWFTIKYVNGTNFWEEHAPFGMQATRGQPVCEMLAADRVRVRHEVDWTSEATGVAIREKRTVTFGFAADGVGLIDWACELHAEQDLKLDRTPYTTWGGYGGLSFRAARELHDASFMLPGGEVVPALAGQPHDWVVLQSSVDGGAKQRVSMGMIDHPSNPRSPSPWYCKAGAGFTYMNAAFLFHEPMSLPRGQTLAMRYRVMYRDGVWAVDEFAALADSYRRSEA